MVLPLKRRKSRSPPGPPNPLQLSLNTLAPVAGARRGLTVAGWSSPVARQAHNLKVVGSNPTPATIEVDPIPEATEGHLKARRTGITSRMRVLRFPYGSARASPRTRSTADPLAAAKAS